MTLSENLLLHSRIDEARTNVAELSADSPVMVIDNPESLEMLLSKYQPVNNWIVRIGYINDVKYKSKTNRNRPAGNEEFGRGLNDPRINAYLDSDEYKTSGQVLYGGNGRVLKSSPVQPPKNPFADTLISFLDVSIQWHSRGYEEKMNQENMIRDRYMDKENRRNRQMQSKDFTKRAQNYADDYGMSYDEVMAKAYEDVEFAKLLNKYVARKDTNKGGGWDGDDNTNVSTHYNTKTKAFRAYIPGKYKITPKYFLVDGEEVKEVSNDFVRFWQREFGSAPKSSPDSGLERLIQRLSKWQYRNYDLNKIAFMSFTYIDENKQHVKFTYVNKQLQIGDHPAAIAQYFVNKLTNSKLKGTMGESVTRKHKRTVRLTRNELMEVISIASRIIAEEKLR